MAINDLQGLDYPSNKPSYPRITHYVAAFLTEETRWREHEKSEQKNKN